MLVRTRGLWGSMFSFAYTGNLPALTGRILGGLWVLLSNLLFFTPRRDVSITVERLDRSRLPELERDKINPWFEAWYNARGREEPTYRPYHFLFGKRSYDFPPRAAMGDIDLSGVRPDVRAEVLAMLADKLKRPLEEAEQQPEATLDQIGLDSLDRMEFALQVEQRFGFTTDQVPGTVGQLWALAAGLVEKGPPRPAPRKWFEPPGTDKPLVLGDTIPEAFLARAIASRKKMAVADDASGVLRYRQLLLGALLVRRWLRGVEAPNVGLLLPASAAGDVAFFGLHLAGKLPVLLNWTTGPANLAHAARTMGLTHVVTSRKFIDRMGIAIEGVQLLCFEDLRRALPRLATMRSWFASRFMPRVLRVPHPDPDSPAVVLFTSGSEKAPKAVPLTHRNLLALIRVGVEALAFRQDDTVLGFLPSFHSFGLAVTMLMPLLTGIRLVRHPDPTDAAALARKCAGYKVTLLVATPTFLNYILDRAEPGQLDTVRLVIVGAERCPAAVAERCKREMPQAILLEGYGITECSPVVAVNTPMANKAGTVGKAMPCVETKVMDLDTGEEQPPGKAGLLLVSGPSIFGGYLGHDGPSPFREIDGKRWYSTGDLVEIDAEGYIRFAGRLKRFVKVGGEMVSLPALEEPFQVRWPATKEGPRAAVEGLEIPGSRRIVLFTTEAVELREANAMLSAAGFRGVMRLDEVRRVEAIPVLGTGKTDYKILRAMIEAGG